VPHAPKLQGEHTSISAKFGTVTHTGTVRRKRSIGSPSAGPRAGGVHRRLEREVLSGALASCSDCPRDVQGVRRVAPINDRLMAARKRLWLLTKRSSRRIPYRSRDRRESSHGPIDQTILKPSWTHVVAGELLLLAEYIDAQATLKMLSRRGCCPPRNHSMSSSSLAHCWHGALIQCPLGVHIGR